MEDSFWTNWVMICWFTGGWLKRLKISRWRFKESGRSERWLRFWVILVVCRWQICHPIDYASCPQVLEIETRDQKAQTCSKSESVCTDHRRCWSLRYVNIWFSVQQSPHFRTKEICFTNGRFLKQGCQSSFHPHDYRIFLYKPSSYCVMRSKQCYKLSPTSPEMGGINHSRMDGLV